MSERSLDQRPQVWQTPLSEHIRMKTDGRLAAILIIQSTSSRILITGEGDGEFLASSTAHDVRPPPSWL